MDNNEIEKLIVQLFSKNNNEAYAALKALIKESEESNKVYKHFETFVKMLDDKNSYIRTRGMFLLANNVKWDKENKFNAIVDSFLKLVEDEKPITSRQCIQSLELVVKYKKELAPVIKKRLLKINYERLPDSMRNLIFKDVDKILSLIKE